MCAVIAVAGEAVELPDQHHIEQLALTVLYHVLELRPVRSSGGQGSVDVTAEDGDAVSFGILRTFAELPFDGFFSLAVRGIAGVNHGFHFVSTSESISYDVLLLDLPYDKEIVEEILELIVDTVCTTKETVRISGDDKPAEVVRSRFLKLDSEHIRFVVSCMKENTTKIKNIRQYLLATLYNASLTMTSYYAALVQHDMAEGRI